MAMLFHRELSVADFYYSVDWRESLPPGITPISVSSREPDGRNISIFR